MPGGIWKGKLVTGKQYLKIKMKEEMIDLKDSRRELV